MSREQLAIKEQKGPEDTYRRSTEEVPRIPLMGRMVAFDPVNEYGQAIETSRYSTKSGSSE
jgi:hypothetical protein